MFYEGFVETIRSNLRLSVTTFYAVLAFLVANDNGHPRCLWRFEDENISGNFLKSITYRLYAIKKSIKHINNYREPSHTACLRQRIRYHA